MPTKAEVLSVTANPEIVKTQEFSNNSSQKATFNVSISQAVDNSSTFS